MALQKPTSNRILPKPDMNNNNNNNHTLHFADTRVVEFPWCPKKSMSSFTSTIKGAFRRTLSSYAKPKKAEAEEEEEGEGSSLHGDDSNKEEEIVVSEIRARAMEARSKRKTSFILMLGDSFRRVILSSTVPAQQGDLCLTAALKEEEEEEIEEEVDDHDDDDFFSVRSYLSRASTGARSVEEFVSVRTNLSRSMSLSGIDDRQLIVLQEMWREEDLRRRMIIKEIIQCEGWPFGLCRKALLLPPLPKSPAESWKWRNPSKFIRAPLK
ncbi:uncharacterized protein LOC124940090 [Impatiens glandulifera]|uniref:uncharacterized protein LOC124940090 n=1 Tax=Impatiens glandulifera TaxID=253017 RepID=UPI001FB0FDC6|nr:uncharacterized protein LOC124940090 [Impatiens glandulifera]